MISRTTFIKKISFTAGVVIITLLMANGCSKSESPKSLTDNPEKPSLSSSENPRINSITTENEPIRTESEAALENAVINTEREEPDATIQSKAEAPNQPEIVRFTFTSFVTDRNPVDELTLVPLSLGKVYTYTVVNSSVPDTIFHVYKFQDKEIARVPIRVGASVSWRTWSTKYLDKIWLGNWDVEIQSKTGIVLAKKSFTLTAKVEETGEEIPEVTEEF